MKELGPASLNSLNRKSFYELSLSVILSLWCLVFLLHSRLGQSHGKESCINEGSNNHTKGMLLESNCSLNTNTYKGLGINSTNSMISVREENGLQEVMRDILSKYRKLECSLSPREEDSTFRQEEKQRSERSSHFIGLDEFRNKTKQGKEKDMNGQLRNIKHRLEPEGTEYNYASASKGAKILAHNKEAKGASNILGRDKDKYLRNPCSAEEKFVVIELSEETLVDAVQIANLEHYSSNFKDFELFGSLTYPTETWISLGHFVAGNVKHAQRFMLPEPKWVRYLRINLLTHYGSEFYCTLSFVEVYGVDAIEKMLEDMIVISDAQATDQSPNSKPVGEVTPKSEVISDNKNGIVQVNSGIDSTERKDSIDDLLKPDTLNTKIEVSISHVPNPVKEVKQQSSGRIPGDSVLKILMQKVKTLELNLTVLEEYLREISKRQKDYLPDLDKELSQTLLLLEKIKDEIKGLVEWKSVVDKELHELESWKYNVSSQIDALVRENILLRLNVDKVLSDEAIMENKEFAVLSVSLFFLCVSLCKLVSEQILKLFRFCRPQEDSRKSTGWLLILVSSTMTALIALLYD